MRFPRTRKPLSGCLSFLLLKTSNIFRKAVHSVIRFAHDYYMPRFDTEQVSDIKSALSLFGDDRQYYQAAGDFLYSTAKQKGGFTSDTALEKLVYLAFTRIRKKWTQLVQNWGKTAQ